MSLTQNFMAVSFRKSRNHIVPAEQRRATSAVSAERIAAAMAKRYIGAVAVSVMVEGETGDIAEPRILSQHGETINLFEDA
ncbi:hypothetical protein [Oryzifoliimicrobium ureilyticus]|uniref:hypothetical protein n=1 Tax=Oryzifoliimicrobium ureilyticus TaxID=3113724 RepID=UPI0030760DD3